MKKNIVFLLSLLIIGSAFLMISCEPEEEDIFAISSVEWRKLTLTISETGGPTNEWYFSEIGSSGMAALTGVDDFSFTYNKTGNNTATIKFQVSGEDKYDLTWTSQLSGTFEQSFNSTPGNPGTFTIVKD